MKGDRIVVGNSLELTENGAVLAVYRPRVNEQGEMIFAQDGGVLLEQIGGVKVGSLGFIDGPSLLTHRTQLLHLRTENATSLGGTNDFAPVFPVFLEQYQQIGWLPGDHIRVVSGGRA
jgi:hypothetical protein